MRELDIIQLFFYLLPAILVGAIAYYFFKMHTQNEQNQRLFLMRKDNQKSSLPIKLQAYERMALFLERISLGKILLRVKPHDNDLSNYESQLIQTIEQEFDHNLSQQIYISGECWNVIKTAKNATITIIRKTAQKEEVDSAGKLREVLLTNLMDQVAPTETALDFVKREVKETI